MLLLGLFLALVFLHSVVSGRLERTVLTAPIAFTSAGMLVAAFVFTQGGSQGEPDFFLRLAEIGLVLLLFADASRTDLGVLRRIRGLPVRLLSTGMLLTLLCGGVSAMGVFPHLTLWEAGILAAVLAPTDAGLGQIIVNSPRVPLKIRQALNVEAGLNDGLSVPFLLFFMALSGVESEGQRATLSRFVVEQLGYGALLGVALGLAGGALLSVARRRQWMAHGAEQLAVVTLPLLGALASEAVGASMFIVAFVAGLAVQVRYKDAGSDGVALTEQCGQVLNLSVFFLFGLLVARAAPLFRWEHLLYGVMSLTWVRMVPVAIALKGTQLCRATVLFMGWFGPRGLASIVLGLVFLEHQTGQQGESTIRLAVMATVLLSIVAHGLSAMPGMEGYSRRVRKLPSSAPELEGAEEGMAGASPVSNHPPTPDGRT